MHVMYYASMLRYWQLVMIVVKTNHPCLRVGRHSWYQSLTGIIHHLRPYFQRLTVRIRLDAHIVVLTGDKLTRIYFLSLLSTIYFSVMTHRQKGKKVSILSSDDVNPGSIPSR
jgi:hypothetical protein